MNPYLFFAFIFALLEALALWKGWIRLEYVAKPAVMIVLLTWLSASVGVNGALLWFGVGILFSLLGDVLLMISLDRMFLFGLVAFLLAHIAYAIGFNIPLPVFSAWSLVFAFMVGLGGTRIIRRILEAIGNNRMRRPVIAYSLVISLMLLSAMMKLTDVTWDAGSAALVSLGAFLFYLSDIVLAWNKFVAPIQNGRIYNIGLYHLGQITLIAGVIAQFG